MIDKTTTLGEMLDSLNELIKEDPSVKDLPVLYYNENNFDILFGNARKIKINEDEFRNSDGFISFAEVNNISEEDSDKLTKTVLLFE
jgi:hypothetical protein